MSTKQDIQEAISEASGIVFFIRWVAFKIYSNVNWWTETNPEGISNMDIIELVTLFILPCMAFLYFVVEFCV